MGKVARFFGENRSLAVVVVVLLLYGILGNVLSRSYSDDQSLEATQSAIHPYASYSWEETDRAAKERDAVATKVCYWVVGVSGFLLLVIIAVAFSGKEKA